MKVHRFREGKSTETATHAFLKNIQEAIEKKKHLIGIFFDLSKAYDVLDHKILLFKLSTYGVRGLVNQWFTSYLSNRKQYVEINYTENTTRTSEKYCSACRGGILFYFIFSCSFLFGDFILHTHIYIYIHAYCWC